MVVLAVFKMEFEGEAMEPSFVLDLLGTTLRVNEIDSYTKKVTTCYLLFELHQDQLCILHHRFGLTHAPIAFRPTLINKGNLEGLKQISQQNIKNAWYWAQDMFNITRW